MGGGGGGWFISDPNTFSDYFVSIGATISRKINYRDYAKKVKCSQSFYCSPTNPFEIVKIIDMLDNIKSTGPNRIPIYILKILKPFFSKLVSKISLEMSKFPDLPKVAKVTPLHDLFPYYLC